MGKSLSGCSGSNRTKQLNNWKSSAWNFTIDGHEARRQLMMKTQQVEAQLHCESTKCQHLETVVQNLTKDVEALKDLHVPSISNHSRRKNWASYTRQHKRVIKKQVATQVQHVLSLCSTTSTQPFKPESMVFLNEETGEKENFDINKGTFSTCKDNDTTAQPSDGDDKVLFALYVKERFDISDRSYLAISKISSNLPRIHELKQQAAELNSKYELKPTSGGIHGVQQSLRNRLMIRLQQLKKHELLPISCKLRVRLSGDGTYIAKNLHVIHFTFTLIDETKSTCTSTASDNHILAILNTQDKYDELKRGLSDIILEAESLNQVEFDSSIYEIEYFLSGDWKFPSIVCGLDSANSEYACIWCKCPKGQRWNMDKNWSLRDTSLGARTVGELQTLSGMKSRNQKFNCFNSPLFSFIPMDHVIIDTLHLFLRISDVLINLLIQDLQRCDGIDKVTTCKIDKGKQTNLARYEKFLNDDCGISFQWYITEGRKFKWRDLNGPEKQRLFSKFNINNICPSLKDAGVIQALWDNFIHLIIEMNSNQDIDVVCFKEKIKDWIRLFISRYQTKNVTPYMHAFAMHVPEFITLYGSLAPFSQQGLEKLNDLATLHYRRATNHHKDSLDQIMRKRNRLEDLMDMDMEPKKKKITCSLCGKVGHNRRSCHTSQ